MNLKLCWLIFITSIFLRAGNLRHAFTQNDLTRTKRGFFQTCNKPIHCWEKVNELFGGINFLVNRQTMKIEKKFIDSNAFILFGKNNISPDIGKVPRPLEMISLQSIVLYSERIQFFRTGRLGRVT